MREQTVRVQYYYSHGNPRSRLPALAIHVFRATVVLAEFAGLADTAAVVDTAALADTAVRVASFAQAALEAPADTTAAGPPGQATLNWVVAARRTGLAAQDMQPGSEAASGTWSAGRCIVVGLAAADSRAERRTGWAGQQERSAAGPVVRSPVRIQRRALGSCLAAGLCRPSFRVQPEPMRAAGFAALAWPCAMR
jgi:hypothetical protein